jgi:hypothetical protein
VTLLYDASVSGQPGTHILAIGVGRYPHLLGGDGKMADKPLGLKQLASPPVSIKALLDWFLAPTLVPGTTGFDNPPAPLVSMIAVASAAQPVTISTPNGNVPLEPATRQNIQDAFEVWLDRLKTHPDNVGVFYFCGHGVMAADHYLLAEDFGRSKAQPWSNAFDISTTIRAVEREVPGTIYYFIDACREISRDLAMTLGADPNALLFLDLSKKVVRRSVTAVFATGEGELAYAPKGGEVSRFTSALVCAMSGYCGIKPPGGVTWNVDGESIAKAIRQLLEYEALDAVGKPGTGKQVSEQSVQGDSVPLLRIPSAPKVKVWLDLAPTQRRAVYELYLLSAKGARVAQTKQDQVFKTELTRGFYEVGAHDPAGGLPAVVHPEEELVPPMFPLTLQSPP